MVPIEQCGIIVLAAGSSRRFGADNKLLTAFRGMPLLGHVLSIVAALPMAQKLLVTGHEHAEVAALGTSYGLVPVHNADYLAGMGTSIACGARNLASSVEAVFIVPGDMPLISAEHFAQLCAQWRTPQTICRPLFDGRPGHPVLFGRAHFAALAKLAGEKGANKVIRAAQHHLVSIEQSNFDVTYDIDTPSDMALKR